MDLIQVKKEFNTPVETIFALLAKHETYNQIFSPAHFVKIKDADDVLRPDGVGSVRKISLGSIALLKEKISYLDENKRIEYQIIQNPLVQYHLGVIEFEALNEAKTLVTYTIQLKVRAPFIGKLILNQLKISLKRGFTKLAETM